MADGPKPGYNEPPPPYAATQGSQGPPGFAVPPTAPTGIIYGQHPITVTGFIPQNAHSPIPVATVIVNVQGFGPHPVQTTCPSCQQMVMTQTLAAPGLLTWILSGTLILIGCWAGCCLIPCCIPECQDIEHRCPNCKNHLGTYRRI